MDTIRWGIIGTGGIANQAATALKLVVGAEVHAVGSRAQETADQFAAKHRIPKAYGSYRQLLDDESVDIVYIATPHPQHKDVALAAIERGKAIVVEKSFAATYSGAREIVDAARAKGVFAMEAMWTRFLPAIQAAREVIAWGRIGDVRGVQGDFVTYFDYDPEHRLFAPDLGGSSLLDLGVYPISTAQFFLGEIKEVHCYARLAPTGVDSAAAISLVHAGGALSSLSCGADAHGPNRFTISGTNGWIDVEPQFHMSGQITINRTGQLPRIIEAKPKGVGYAHQFAEAQRLLQEGATESPTMPLAETLEIMDVLQTCLEQAGVQTYDVEVDLG